MEANKTESAIQNGENKNILVPNSNEGKCLNVKVLKYVRTFVLVLSFTCMVSC